MLFLWGSIIVTPELLSGVIRSSSLTVTLVLMSGSLIFLMSILRGGFFVRRARVNRRKCRFMTWDYYRYWHHFRSRSSLFSHISYYMIFSVICQNIIKVIKFSSLTTNYYWLAGRPIRRSCHLFQMENNFEKLLLLWNYNTLVSTLNAADKSRKS